MIWLLAHPLPPLLSVSSTGDTKTEKEIQVAKGRVVKGLGRGEEPNHLTARKPGLL
jgi:hypothetical protein